MHCAAHARASHIHHLDSCGSGMQLLPITSTSAKSWRSVSWRVQESGLRTRDKPKVDDFDVVWKELACTIGFFFNNFLLNNAEPTSDRFNFVTHKILSICCFYVRFWYFFCVVKISCIRVSSLNVNKRIISFFLRSFSCLLDSCHIIFWTIHTMTF